MNISLKHNIFKSFLFLFLIGMSVSMTAQEAYSAKNEGWVVKIEEAYELSQKTGKPILANFTGSDWCGWCKRLDKSVFHRDAFKKWADQNVVLLELDYPRRTKLPEEIRKQNADLQRAFKITGYPTIWVFDLTKDDKGQYQIAALGKTGYAKTPGDFTSACDKMIAQRQKQTTTGKTE